MAEILNQNEIDALLSEIDFGEAIEEQAPEKKKRQISIYDFRHPNLISKDHLRMLQMVHERFCQLLENYLTSKLRTLVNVKLIAVDQVTYSEFSLSMSDPSCIYILRIEELQGDAIMELTLPFVFYSIDRLLGGEGRGIDVNRELTLIEQRVIGAIAAEMVREMNNAWIQVTQLNAFLSSYQSRPNFIQIAPIEEIVISVSIEVKAQQTTGFINLCFPIQIFETILPKMTAHQMIRSRKIERTDDEKSHLYKKIYSVKMPIHAELGRRSISLKEFIELEEGDVIRLNSEINGDVPIFVNGALRYKGRPGTMQNRIALEINEEIPIDTDD
ncbi:MAG: flagellar motor switch protein FliM [Deferribacteres bacterium]|nr:flagellar motor switch protein FliM [candidate division KSB1 bacterium]MCB9501935.1 flagellar motor switch protein FliM [Deferribacteres bacterium]